MKFKEKSEIDVMAVTDMDETYPGIAYMTKALKNVYPVLRALPIIDSLKMPETNDPVLIFKYLNDTLSSLPSKDFSIIREDDEYIVRKELTNNFNDYCFYGLPISFLPELLVVNEDLHDLFCMCISILVSKGIPCIDPEHYDMDYEIDTIREMIENDEEKDTVDLRHELELFLRNKSSYENLLSVPADIEYIKYEIGSTSMPGSIRNQFIDVLPYLVLINASHTDLDEISENALIQHAKSLDMEPDMIFEQGTPVDLLQVFRIIWFSDVRYTSWICDVLGDYAGNYGEILPIVCKDCKTAEEFNQVDNEFEQLYGTLVEDMANAINILKDLTEDIIKYIEQCKKKPKHSDHQVYSLFIQP